jgi:hypothetical protein
LLLSCGALASPAAAQQTVTDVIGFLVTNQAVPTASIERDQAAAEAARDTMSRALLVNLTSVPLATSSSGFLYRLNPQLGTVERATESFGAFFVERALTAGKGHASFGVTASSSAFDQLDGQNLRDGTLVTIANKFRDESAPFDTESLTLQVRSSTMTLFGSVGITDRLEVGGAVPFVQLTLNGSRVNVYRGTTFMQASGSASASGIGDMALRAKYTLFSTRAGGIAAAGEIRLPTGDEMNLLGAGTRSYRVMGIGSVEAGRLSLHGNAGLVRGGVSDETNFSGAASVAAHPRVTISGEVLVRNVTALHPIELVSAPHPTISGVDTLRLLSGDTGTTLADALVGFKWNVSGKLVLGGHATWPLVKHGLTAPFTPTFALEYAF